MSDHFVIQVEGLWKRYGLPFKPALRDMWRRLQSGRASQSQNDVPNDDGPWALRDLSFEVRHGETLGVIGPNGAGKSTLLKVLAGTTPPTRGKFEVRGRIFPMIELNAGLHPELTGRENARLLGAIMGFTRKDINARMPKIEDFCELSEWFDRPVRMYSSGMLARLGFAVALNVEADVLLVDEVLSVGDLAFQAKAYDHMERLRKKGSAILLITHGLRYVQRICERAILLNHGQIITQGDARDVVSEYYKIGQARIDNQHAESGYVPLQENTGEIIIKGISLLDEGGNELRHVYSLTHVTIRVYLEVAKSMSVPNFSIGILTSDMMDVARIVGSFPDKGNAKLEPGATYVDCIVERFPLLPGEYSISALIASWDGKYRLAQIDRALFFTVLTDQGRYRHGTGFIELDAQWSLENSGSSRITA